MLPIALTCPVWWVARWTARMLASLAVVVACSLGATTLPVGTAASAPAAARLAGPVEGSSRVGKSVAASDSAHARLLIRWSDRADAAGRARSGALGLPAGTATSPAGSGTRAGSAARSAPRSGAWDRDAAGALPGVVPAAAPPRPTGVVPVGRQRPPAGAPPATAGSRAPPAR
ncbi:hypothetical protein ACL02O_10385 [Micromonospora sp. MS34]|uniref:hypothetical protein n=1 Tax=Micromonospora sp. MS34 TaxID=3385971 RepID=UPI00399F0B72